MGVSLAIVIVGGGGHAKVAYDLFVACKELVIGVIDRSPVQHSQLKYLGDDTAWPTLLAQGVRRAHVAIGDNVLRSRLCEDLQSRGVELVTGIHPTSYIASSSRLGPGVIVMAGAVVQPSCDIGAYCIINTRASVDHDGRLGRGVHIGPGVTLAGSVAIGDLSFVGAGSTVIPGVTIGSDTLVGAGSCVVRPLPDNVIAYGVPARPVRPHRITSIKTGR